MRPRHQAHAGPSSRPSVPPRAVSHPSVLQEKRALLPVRARVSPTPARHQQLTTILPTPYPDLSLPLPLPASPSPSPAAAGPSAVRTVWLSTQPPAAGAAAAAPPTAAVGESSERLSAQAAAAPLLASLGAQLPPLRGPGPATPDPAPAALPPAQLPSAPRQPATLTARPLQTAFRWPSPRRPQTEEGGAGVG
ncbi:hypothetical protein B0A49_07511, partial [Cryomyces minteri]